MNSYVHKPCKPGHYVMDNGMTVSKSAIEMQSATKRKCGNLAYSLQADWCCDSVMETKLILERLCVITT